MWISSISKALIKIFCAVVLNLTDRQGKIIYDPVQREYRNEFSVSLNEHLGK